MRQMLLRLAHLVSLRRLRRNQQLLQLQQALQGTGLAQLLQRTHPAQPLSQLPSQLVQKAVLQLQLTRSRVRKLL